MHAPSPPLTAPMPVLLVDDQAIVAEALPPAGESSTGLGLAIRRKIVEAHGGVIRAENLPERGCAFRVMLPA